jgi:hypothetical protein
VELKTRLELTAIFNRKRELSKLAEYIVRINKLIRLLKDYFCQEFTGFEGKLGRQKFLGSIERVRSKDLVPIALFSGLLSALLIFLLMFLLLPGLDGLYHSEVLLSKIPLYRSLLVIIGSFLGAGICIHFFRKYKINYIYIFEIVPSNKLNQYQMIKMFLYLLFLWVIAALVEVIRIK